jgi:hypothetical protein
MYVDDSILMYMGHMKQSGKLLTESPYPKHSL